MKGLMISEHLKGKRSFARKGLVLFPVFVALAAVVLMGGQFTQVGAFNWWYTMLLPVTLTLLCVQLILPDKQNGYFAISSLPYAKGKSWVAKTVLGCAYLFFANTMVFLLTSISGAIFGSQYAVWRGIAAALILTITYAWQVPAALFVVAKFGATFAFVSILFLNTISGIQTVSGGKFWFIPTAIPARLLAPIIGVNPNGVPLEAGSPLWNTRVVLPGIMIAFCLFVFMFAITYRLFNKESN